MEPVFDFNSFFYFVKIMIHKNLFFFFSFSQANAIKLENVIQMEEKVTCWSSISRRVSLLFLLRALNSSAGLVNLETLFFIIFYSDAFFILFFHYFCSFKFLSNFDLFSSFFSTFWFDFFSCVAIFRPKRDEVN